MGIWMKYGLLTEKQYLVLKYRVQGLTQEEIARILGISRSTVAAIEKSALRKIRMAEETIRLYRLLHAAGYIDIPAGTHMAEIPGMLIRKADELGVKLKGDFNLIYGQLRLLIGTRVTRLPRSVRAVIHSDGSYEFYLLT
ncbi:Tfx family DNA-binding protein [Desulfurococcus sp.]|uniref:Tfx family DNA-binding protein n=2 Tax=Desulfurococcus sp. TaxID=51678 RepID=UPI003165471B